MNYYRRYIGDYGKKTSLLSLAEHGAYALLLDYYYAEEKPLPADMEDIYRLTRAVKPEERKAVDKVLAKYFREEPDGFHNERADEELDRAQPAIETAKINGAKGGRKKNPPGSENSEEKNPPGSKTGSGKEPNGLFEGGKKEPTGIAIRRGDPTTNHHPPSATPQPPPASQSQTPSEPAARPRPARAVPATGPVWSAYGGAYRDRWGVEPLRNAKVNGMLARFLDRVPIEEAPQIASFFVRSNRGLYVSAKHAVDLLLRDAEALRTEWATGRSSTDTEARQTDRTQANGNAFRALIDETDSERDAA